MEKAATTAWWIATTDFLGPCNAVFDLIVGWKLTRWLRLFVLFVSFVHGCHHFPFVETYHMVDTCDPTVACWSEDGETFVVKNPEKFEKQIIPQFFKHSKFSSFVRVRFECCFHDSHISSSSSSSNNDTHPCPSFATFTHTHLTPSLEQ